MRLDIPFHSGFLVAHLAFFKANRWNILLVSNRYCFCHRLGMPTPAYQHLNISTSQHLDVSTSQHLKHLSIEDIATRGIWPVLLLDIDHWTCHLRLHTGWDIGPLDMAVLTLDIGTWGNWDIGKLGHGDIGLQHLAWR